VEQLSLAKKKLRIYKRYMTTVKEIEEAVEHLPPKGLNQFREWFEAFETAAWNRKLEGDVSSGKLDSLINEAQSEYKSGKTSEL
jgi:hypothetical protein